MQNFLRVPMAAGDQSMFIAIDKIIMFSPRDKGTAVIFAGCDDEYFIPMNIEQFVQALRSQMSNL